MKKIALASLAFLTLMAPAFASPHPRVHEVNGRRDNQHERIQAGVQNGSLTHKEAYRLRSEGKAIHAQEKYMRSQDGGHLTKTDQRLLNREQNMRSRQIYRQKHD